jgi:CHAP domain
MSFTRGSFNKGLKWILLFALVVMVAGLLQLPRLRPVSADTVDTGGYPWSDATYVDANYDWGYSKCPTDDTNCMSLYGYKVVNGVNTKFGEADPWGYNLRNCTSYVAWKINQVFHVNNISGWGNASTWNKGFTKPQTYPVYSASNYRPQEGDIAQWVNAAGGLGHVAYVWHVESNGIADLYDYNEGNYVNGVQVWGVFSSINTTAKTSEGTPNNYIHIGKIPSTPSAVSRSGSDMAVFYNDGNSNLVNWSWSANTGWTKQQWADPGGIIGQPAVVSRTSDTMDVFYTTGQHKLIHKGWWANTGWVYFDVLLSGDVAGDPTAIARDSGHIQVFYRTLEGEIKSISWVYNSSGGTWNTNPQNLYPSGAATDPYAVTRSSNSMEVFFGNSSGNIVHLGWSSTYGWVTQSWATNSPVKNKPTAIVRNGGGDMSSYYRMNNGNVGEEAWDWQYSWSGQYWTAQIVGSPSATAGVHNVIDDFYRETGGNIVDRYFTGTGWYTTNIVGSGGATSDPFAITRGTTSQEVFYWNGSKLMDANWNTTSHSWSTAQIH